MSSANIFADIINEIVLLEYLSHDNIIRAHGVALSDDYARLIMDNYEMNIYQYVELYGRDREREMSISLFRALDYIHGRGIIHCNINPANILIKTQREAAPKVVLAGFGAAMITSLASCCKGPITDFTAPETKKTGTVSGASDIWSLGHTLLFLFGCETSLFNIIQSCIEMAPECRITAREALICLNDEIGDGAGRQVAPSDGGAPMAKLRVTRGIGRIILSQCSDRCLYTADKLFMGLRAHWDDYNLVYLREICILLVAIVDGKSRGAYDAIMSRHNKKIYADIVNILIISDYNILSI